MGETDRKRGVATSLVIFSVDESIYYQWVGFEKEGRDLGI